MINKRKILIVKLLKSKSKFKCKKSANRLWSVATRQRCKKLLQQRQKLMLSSPKWKLWLHKCQKWSRRKFLSLPLLRTLKCVKNNLLTAITLLLRRFIRKKSFPTSCHFPKDLMTYSNSSHLSTALWTFFIPDRRALPTPISEKWLKINPRENSPSNISDKYCKLNQISITTNGRGNLASRNLCSLFHKTWKKYCAPKKKVHNMKSPQWAIKGIWWVKSWRRERFCSNKDS